MLNEVITKCSQAFTIARKTLIDKKGGNSKYCIENNDNKRFIQIDFEECVYANKQDDTKCDFGIQVDNFAFFIELKGSDVKKGVEQLLATINETKAYYNDKTLYARLIISKFPKPQLVKQTKQYKDLNKLVSQNLIIKQNIYTEKI